MFCACQESLCTVKKPSYCHSVRRELTGAGSRRRDHEAAINGSAHALLTYNVADFQLAGVRFGIPIQWITLAKKNYFGGAARKRRAAADLISGLG
jgi:hypothetical protein